MTVTVAVPAGGEEVEMADKGVVNSQLRLVGDDEELLGAKPIPCCVTAACVDSFDFEPIFGVVTLITIWGQADEVLT